MILNQGNAKTVKWALDAQFPIWRQVGTAGGDVLWPEDPPLVRIEIDGLVHVVAAGSSNSVFGIGHLSIEAMWAPDSEWGCALKCDEHVLDAIGATEIPGFVHMHRAGVTLGIGDEGPDREACAYFQAHPGEFSAFIPVTFRHQPEAERYHWRAHLREVGSL